MLRIILSGIMVAAGLPVVARTWTTSIGRTFEAEFVSMDGNGAIFVLSNGRKFSMPVVDLSPADPLTIRFVG